MRDTDPKVFQKRQAKGATTEGKQVEEEEDDDGMDIDMGQGGADSKKKK